MPDNQNQQGGITGDIHHHVDILTKLMYAVIIVLFIGFAAAFISVVTLWIQSLNDKTTSNQQLEIQIATQNAKIDTLSAEVANLIGVEQAR